MMKVTRLLHPEVVFPSVYLIFLACAYLGYRIEVTSRYLTQAFGELHGLSFLLSLFGIALVTASAWLGRRVEVKLNPDYLLPVMAALAFFALQSTFPEQLFVNLVIALGSIGFWLVFTRYGSLNALLAGAYALAVAAAALTLSQGIPLLEASFRESVAVSPARAVFHGLAVLSASLLIVLTSWRVAAPGIALLVLLGVLSGFKSDAIAVILSSVIAGLLAQRISLRALLPALAGVGIILTLVSTHIASVAYSSWKIPPHLYIFYRTGFTFSVFDRIVELSLPWGLLHGSALADVSQVITSKVVLGYQQEHIITSTLFGPATLDFGIPGLIIIAMLVGVYLGIMHRLAKSSLGIASYAVALTHVLILIEVGLQPTSVLFLLTLLYLSLSANRVR
jgi:oligosaccharide repeat unit polymerase